LIFVRGLRGPYGKGVVGHSLNPPLAAAAGRWAVAPLLLGARHPPLLIDISRPHGAQQQTLSTPLLRRMTGQTDGRTDGHLNVTQHLLRTLCGQCQ